MYGVLKGTLLVGLAVLLSSCWHGAFHTSIENGTTKKVYVVIHFVNSQIPPGHGYIEPGNRVNLPQRLEDINSIEYRVGNRECRMDKRLIEQAANGENEGIRIIRMRDCGGAPYAITGRD